MMMPLLRSCISSSLFFVPASPPPLSLRHAPLFHRRSLSSPNPSSFTALPLSPFLTCAVWRITRAIAPPLNGEEAVEVAASKHVEGFCCFDFKSPEWLRLMSSLLILVVAGNLLVESAYALDQGPPPAEKNELIQKLLEKSRANKAKYDKERRDAYYKRNYKDYFEFVEGSIRRKGKPSEAEKGILEWLERNK